MAVDFEFKSKYNVDDLLSIMRILREPGGCPWDMEQTHESIKRILSKRPMRSLRLSTKRIRSFYARSSAMF